MKEEDAQCPPNIQFRPFSVDITMASVTTTTARKIINKSPTFILSLFYEVYKIGLR